MTTPIIEKLRKEFQDRFVKGGQVKPNDVNGPAEWDEWLDGSVWESKSFLKSALEEAYKAGREETSISCIDICVKERESARREAIAECVAVGEKEKDLIRFDDETSATQAVIDYQQAIKKLLE